MIFSAVALVAFSFAGMANEVKEKKEEAKKVVKKDCVAMAILALNMYDPNMDLSDEAAIFFYQVVWTACEVSK